MSTNNQQSQAAYIERPLGVIRVTGESRLDLIDRMSTQKVKQLQGGEGAATVLTTDIGRIIDRLLIYADENEMFFLTGENNAANIFGYFMRYIFFNDDFHMTDVTAETAVIGVYGSTAQTQLNQLGVETELPRHHWRKGEIGGVSVSVHRADPVQGDGYLLVVSTAEADQLKAQLETAGITPIDQAEFEQMRVASGLPLFGHELTTDYIPLETDLWDDVSFNKGCYIGQEIIARMESRGRISKKLVRLEADGELEMGAEITADGKKAGTITSVAGQLAMGYVKTAALEAETPLQVNGTILKIREN